jgi:hypothetical protein
MKQIIINFIFIVVVSTILFFLFTINASLDTSYILALLIILVLQTSLIISILLIKTKK